MRGLAQEHYIKRTMEAVCTLCESPLAGHTMREGNQLFCCPGCHGVYQILGARGQLTGYQETALFKQAVQAGLISNPYLLERMRQAQTDLAAETRQTLHFEITDLWCPSCAEVIRLILLQQPGVVNCFVDYFTDLASVEFAPRYLSRERIFERISSIGYHPVLLEDSETSQISRSLWLRFLVAAFGAFNLMMFASPIYASYFTEDSLGYAQLFGWLSLGVSLPVISYCAWPFYQRAWSAAWVGYVGMEALVVIGVSAAFFYSLYELAHGGIHVYFDSMAVIVTFMLLGKILESKAKFSAKESLLRLTHTLPRRGRKRFSDGSEQFIPLKEIQIGDLLVVRTGEKIVLDGMIVEGEGAVDESLLTGEVTPVMKVPGKSVTAGTYLRQGWFVFRATVAPEKTFLQQLIALVEKNLATKSCSVRLTDQIATWFVPVTVILSALTGIYLWSQGEQEAAVLRSLSILLISCPCAIGIAIPLAESYLMQGLAALGAIVRNRRCLTWLGRETVFVFDKTGTITQGVFDLQSGIEELSQENRSILKGLTSRSIHPMSCAIAQSIEGSARKLDRVEEINGQGVEGQLGNAIYLVGSRRFLASRGIQLPPLKTSDTPLLSEVYFARNGQWLTTLVLGDQLRQEAAETISALSMRTCLVSGDSLSVVEQVGRLCHFDEWHAGCSPLQKKAFVEQLSARGEIVAMLGDGINDTLALSSAHVAISVVSATDVSIQASDLLLTTERLSILPRLQALARKGRRVVKQNLFWAFFYNLIGMWLALTGLLTPLFAAFAMAMSSLIVLCNGRRLMRHYTKES